MEELALTSADGTSLRAIRWTPDEVRADVLICHGLAEHMGRYEHVAAALNAAGFRVTGIELRGHGKSGGPRGHVERWSDYVADLSAAAATIEGPYLLLGHSMGGLVSLDFAREARGLHAVAVSAPLLGVAVRAPTWKVWAGRLLSVVLPGLPMNNELDPTTVCSDPEVVAAYTSDPLVFDTITPRWFTEMNAARDRVNAHAPAYHLPLYALWGTKDRIVSTEAIERFASLWGGPKATRPWEGLFHEAFNEPSRDQVLGELVRWLETRIP